MRYRTGDKIQGRVKHHHKKLTVRGGNGVTYEVESDGGRENGRVHYMKRALVDRFYVRRER